MAADQLQTIVQRMVDAGESEDNIASVIQHFKTHSAGATPIDPHEPDTYAGGVLKSLKQQLADAVGPAPTGDEFAFAHAAGPRAVAAMNTPLVRPTGTAADNLASPASLAMIAMAAPGKAMMRGAANVLDEVPAFRRAVPFAQRVTGALRTMGTPQPTVTLDPSTWADSNPEAWRGERPPATGPLTPTDAGGRPLGVAPGAAAQPAETGLSAEQRAYLVKQNYDPAMIAKIEAQMAQQPPPPMTSGTLRPVASHTPTSPELQQPRVDIGAEKVGRSIGLTKEQVRQQTAPILGEQPGEASPIFPEKALQSIIDTMKALPKDGPARAEYVARATSGKAQWQVENLRRTLEHLGLVVPAAAAVSPSIRDMLLQQMRAGVTDQD